MEKLFLFTSKYIFPSKPEAGILGSIDFNLSLLQWSGIPFFGSRSESKTIIIIYGVIMVLFVRILYQIFEIYDLIYCWRNVNDMTQNICLFMAHFGGMLKTVMVFSRLNDVYRIVKQFKFMTEKYIRSKKQKEAFAWIEFENKSSLLLYAVFIGIAAIFGMAVALINPLTVIGKVFPYRSKMPDIIPFTVQLIYTPIAVLIIGFQIVGVDYLNVTFINLTRCQLQVLNLSLDELNEAVVGEVTVNPLTHLNNLVEHHNYILDIRNQIESVFKLPMLVQFVASLLIFALTGFQALIRSDISGLAMIYFYVGCIFAELFLYCWFGNEVSEQNKTLASRGYETSWYNFDTKFRKTLLIFLLNAQQPFSFTAGGYVDLSLLTFSRILSKSYTYMAVLRQQYIGKQA